MLEHKTWKTWDDNGDINWILHTVEETGRPVGQLIELSTYNDSDGMVRLSMSTIPPKFDGDVYDYTTMTAKALNGAHLDHIVTYPEGDHITYYIKPFSGIETPAEFVERMAKIWREITENPATR